jgi:hypothetical protein
MLKSDVSPLVLVTKDDPKMLTSFSQISFNALKDNNLPDIEIFSHQISPKKTTAWAL